MPNPLDSGGNVRVDHVWGNLPIQPDDERPADKKLNASLGFHEIATTGHSNYPGFTPNSAGDGDPTLDVVVPNVVGLTEAAATAALVKEFLAKGAVTTTSVGATAGNNGTVKTQTPAAGASADAGATVALVLYAV